jgi:hypothetical protein
LIIGGGRPGVVGGDPFQRLRRNGSIKAKSGEDDAVQEIVSVDF